MYYTYILYSLSNDRYYIGQTKDLSQRFHFHRLGSTRETAGVQDWQLVFLETKSTRAEAMALELKIKRAKSRKSLQRYIANAANEMKVPTLLITHPHYRRVCDRQTQGRAQIHQSLFRRG